jgi:hypothetical protein
MLKRSKDHLPSFVVLVAGGGSGENNVNVELAMSVPEDKTKVATNLGDDIFIQRKLENTVDLQSIYAAIYAGNLDLGDWAQCHFNSQCRNGCCSNRYSHDGVDKCTPLNGGYNADICNPGGGSPRIGNFAPQVLNAVMTAAAIFTQTMEGLSALLLEASNLIKVASKGGVMLEKGTSSI